jgi:hypothetical protein
MRPSTQLWSSALRDTISRPGSGEVLLRAKDTRGHGLLPQSPGQSGEQRHFVWAAPLPAHPLRKASPPANPPDLQTIQPDRTMRRINQYDTCYSITIGLACQAFLLGMTSGRRRIECVPAITSFHLRRLQARSCHPPGLRRAGHPAVRRAPRSRRLRPPAPGWAGRTAHRRRSRPARRMCRFPW